MNVNLERTPRIALAVALALTAIVVTKRAVEAATFYCTVEDAYYCTAGLRW